MMSSKPQIITHVNKSVPFTVYDAKWIPNTGKVVSVGSFPRETGALNVWELNKGDLKPIAKAEKTSSFKCCTFGTSCTNDRLVATGDFEGKLSIWDLEHLDVPVYNCKAHTEITNSIDGFSAVGAPEIVTGGRDGKVCVWDPRQKGKPVASFEPASDTEKADCWAVRFGNSYSDAERFVCAGYDNGDLKMFDLRVNSIHWETNVRNGICSIDFDRRDIEMNKLVVTMLESKFRVFDLRTCHPEKGYSYLVEKAHNSTVWFGRHLPQNRDIFATTGGDGSVNVYKYNYPPTRSEKDPQGSSVGIMGKLEMLASVQVSPQPIVSIDWNINKEGLACMASLDQSIKVLIVTKLHTL